MNAGSKTHGRKLRLKPLVFALALTLPAATAGAGAAEHGDAVTNGLTQTGGAGNDNSAYAMPSDQHSVINEPLQGEYLVVMPSGEDQGPVVLEDEPFEDEDMALVDDGTAKQFNRGYYEEPDQVAAVVVTPDSENSAALEALQTSEDGTARQFDRGYYKDPETVAAVVIEPNDSSLVWSQTLDLISSAEAE